MTLFSLADLKEPVKEVPFKTLTSFELPAEVAFYAEENQIPIVKKAIPKNVKILDGKKVKIKGFMVPVVYDKDYKITSFLLAPDQTSCCFGKIPNLNGFIYSTSTKGIKYLKDTLIEVTGTLATEPKMYKKEKCVLIYKLTVESVKMIQYKGAAKGATQGLAP